MMIVIMLFLTTAAFAMAASSIMLVMYSDAQCPCSAQFQSDAKTMLVILQSTLCATA